MLVSRYSGAPRRCCTGHGEGAARVCGGAGQEPGKAQQCGAWPWLGGGADDAAMGGAQEVGRIRVRRRQ